MCLCVSKFNRLKKHLCHLVPTFQYRMEIFKKEREERLEEFRIGGKEGISRLVQHANKCSIWILFI